VREESELKKRRFDQKKIIRGDKTGVAPSEGEKRRRGQEGERQQLERHNGGGVAGQRRGGGKGGKILSVEEGKEGRDLEASPRKILVEGNQYRPQGKPYAKTSLILSMIRYFGEGQSSKRNSIGKGRENLQTTPVSEEQLR